MSLLLKISIPFILAGPPSDKKKDIDHCRDVVGVWSPAEGVSKNYIYDKQIYDFNVEDLAQVKFWRSIMNLSKDSAIINVAGTRQVIQSVSVKEWNKLSDEKKALYRDSVRQANCFSDSTRILITEGKNFFYDFDQAIHKIPRGVDNFIENGVDPWYAQAILLIESPNKLQKSNVGAYGPFQLMKPVARMFGLKVNKKVDERADFDRSAYAASCLISRICIPKAKEMLDTMGIAYHEQDLWFRLLVMHCYHAGVGNVRAALAAIDPKEGGMDLIQQLWQTQAKGFRTASQNYSQLVLAAMLEMDTRIMDRLSIASNP